MPGKLVQFLADIKKTVKNKFLLLELECLILMLGLITRLAKTFPMCKVQKKGRGAHEPKAQAAGVYTGFISMKHLGVLLLHPGRDASPPQGYPPTVWCRYAFIYLGEERQSEVKFLV